MRSGMEKVTELRGDGLRVGLTSNDFKLRVSGDGCRVKVARNCGSIRVIGDGCSVEVKRNDGDIEYRGDGGIIILGAGSRTESVSYVGNGGRIAVNGEKLAGKSKPRVDCSVSESELELENAANENKETADRRRRRKIFRRYGTTVVTKISTSEIPLIVNGSFVRNWLPNPPSVVKFFEASTESI